MSSIATFYVLPTSKRHAFAEAKKQEKVISRRPRFFGFGSREVITGERYLWEYLDQAAVSRQEFDPSGFVIVDYFLTFVQLPGPLQDQLTAAASSDGHYFQFEQSFAAEIAAFLEAHPPDQVELSKFASEQGQDPSAYPSLLTESHTTLIQWFRSISALEFGVLHLTF